MNRLALLSLLPLLFTCQSKLSEPMAIQGFELSSTSPDSLAAWYVTNLGMTSTLDGASVQLWNERTTISIRHADTGSISVSSERNPGFFKIGFKTNSLDELAQRLKLSNTTFRGGRFYDDKLKTRSLVVLDSDGNRVQFFEDTSSAVLTPYFFSLMTIDIKQTKAWCESAFGFAEAHNLDLPERGLSIRLMQKDDMLLELIEDTQLVASTSRVSKVLYSQRPAPEKQQENSFITVISGQNNSTTDTFLPLTFLKATS
jgi:hypothetical protein